MDFETAEFLNIMNINQILSRLMRSNKSSKVRALGITEKNLLYLRCKTFPKR